MSPSSCVGGIKRIGECYMCCVKDGHKIVVSVSGMAINWVVVVFVF